MKALSLAIQMLHGECKDFCEQTKGQKGGQTDKPTGKKTKCLRSIDARA